MIRAVGACCGLLAFSIAIFRGLSVGNPPFLILERAVWAMLLFFVLGTALGWAARHIVLEHAMQKEAEALQPFQEEDEGEDEKAVAEVQQASAPSTDENSTAPDSKPIAT